MRLGSPFFGSCDCDHTSTCAGTFGSGLMPYSSLPFKAVDNSLQWLVWLFLMQSSTPSMSAEDTVDFAQVASEMGMSTEKQECGQSWHSADSEGWLFGSSLSRKWLFSSANPFSPSGHWGLRWLRGMTASGKLWNCSFLSTRILMIWREAPAEMMGNLLLSFFYLALCFDVKNVDPNWQS